MRTVASGGNGGQGRLAGAVLVELEVVFGPLRLPGVTDSSVTCSWSIFFPLPPPHESKMRCVQHLENGGWWLI